MASSNTFPIIFTIAGSSSRHELLLISPGTKLADLTSQIEAVASTSVNTQEFLAKYAKKKSQPDRVETIRVRWAGAGRDAKTFPATTVLTEDNVEAALRLVEASGVGKDVLEVTIAEGPPAEEKKKE
ncbi:hypothetical protein IWX90DRAFT_480852 [Phyllosticta citrichinensis]|uniref:Uncharacterized protein n=1 Tax=Phyllosticta citrichinensis TaxID=1130410 RepID=A0ABR1XIF9_9PEZI